MVLGHLTVTAAAHRLARQRLSPSARFPLGWLLVGAYVPDLLDKPMAILTGLAGRGYGHSLVVQLAFFAVAAALLRGRARVLAALAVGSALHIIEDGVGLRIVLAPLLGPVPFVPTIPLLEKVRVFYVSGGPPVWIEVCAVVYWIWVGALALRHRLGEPEAAADVA